MTNDITPSPGLKSPHVRGRVSFSLCCLAALSRSWATRRAPSLLSEGERLQQRRRGPRGPREGEGMGEKNERGEVGFILFKAVFAVLCR